MIDIEGTKRWKWSQEDIEIKNEDIRQLNLCVKEGYLASHVRQAPAANNQNSTLEARGAALEADIQNQMRNAQRRMASGDPSIITNMIFGDKGVLQKCGSPNDSRAYARCEQSARDAHFFNSLGVDLFN